MLSPERAGLDSDLAVRGDDRVSGRRNVYYVGSFRFPDGDAAAARVLGTARALRDAGARVVFGGWEKNGRVEDLQADGTYRFDRFLYFPQADLRHMHLSPARRLAAGLFAGKNTLRWLMSQPIQPGDVIIAYHGGAWFLSRLWHWCQIRNLRLVLDLTEWYSPRQLPGGRLGPAWWDSEIGMRFVKPKAERIMAISSYLQRYYASKGCAVLRVPPLIDLQNPRWIPIGRTPPERAPLRLAYAGVPGRKDLLVNVLRGLATLREPDEAVVLNLFGPSRESLVQVVPESAHWLSLLGERVVFHGSVPQSDVPRRLMESHFTVLLRRDERYARAGFPTKIVESLGAGVPVITNPSSDLTLYIQDGKEGVLLADESSEAFASGVRRLMALGPATWLNMRAAARQRAEISFDYRRHIEPIRQFVLEVDHRTPSA